MLAFNHLTDLEGRCFKAVLKYLVDQDKEGLDSTDLMAIQFERIPRAFVRMALDSLVASNFLTMRKSALSSLMVWHLHPAIAKEAYAFVESGYLLPGDFSSNEKPLPAADRFVALDHNSSEFIEADQALDALQEGITKSNELFADKSERLAVASEVASLRDHLQGATVRVTVLIEAVRNRAIIAWLAREAMSGVIRSLAVKAFEGLLALVRSLGTA